MANSNVQVPLFEAENHYFGTVKIETLFMDVLELVKQSKKESEATTNDRAAQHEKFGK